MFMRDLFLIGIVSIGIYSHTSALTSHFMLHQRSTKQEKQLTYLFHEQPEGLIVLKERKEAADPTTGDMT